MNKLRSTLLLSAAIVFFTGKNFAQISFVKGYLISDKGDTLRGEVKINPKKEHDNHNKVFFKDAAGIQKNYKPNKVKGYGYDNNHYVSITQDDEAKFYKRLTNGAIILYKGAFEVANMNAVSYEFDYYLFKEGDKKLTEVKEGKFKKQLQEWMSGSAGFANDFKDEKEFNEASAIEVITKYNEWKKNN